MVSARDWHAKLAEPSLFGHLDRAGNLALIRFRDIPARIEQPAMLENVISMHLGGAKRVTRLRDQVREVFDVDERSLTIMPASEAYGWKTEGPIDFAHLTLSTDIIGRIAIEEFDRDASHLRLRPVVGAVDAVVGTLFQALLADVERSKVGGLYRESLLFALCFNLTCRFSNVGDLDSLAASAVAKGGLASWQLRRVIDYMRHHLSEDFTLTEIVALTGLSRSQFFRAFGCSTGRSPYAYFTELRIRRAQEILRDTDVAIGIVARRVGLEHGQLSSFFRKRLGVSPSAYRRELGGNVTDE